MTKTLFERRQELKQKAVEIGLCKSCFRELPASGSDRGEKCLQAVAKHSQKLRDTPGRCKRCGQHNDRSKTHKTCTKCLEYNRLAYQNK